MDDSIAVILAQQKPTLPQPAKKLRPGRPGVTHALAEHPDRVNEARLVACPHCAHTLGPADQADIHAYDHIELPPIAGGRRVHG